MLILTRRIHETIYIGDDITVSIVGVDRYTGQVRVGIRAPKDVPVHREEIHRRIESQRREEPDA